MNNAPVPAKPTQDRKTAALNIGVFRMPEPSMFDVRCSCLFLISVLLFFTAAAGCGKKGMPVPPGAEPVPAVSDLSHEVAGGYVHLEWTVPMDAAGGEAVVSRARTELSDGCDGCPLVFQQVAVKSIHPMRGAVKQTFQEALTPGFRYTYRVVLKVDGAAGGASNLVTFDY